MLVFLVVLPRIAVDANRHQRRQAKQADARGYIVVEDNSNQFPLGVLTFKPRKGIRRRQSLRTSTAPSPITTRCPTNVTTAIMQNIIQDKFDLAQSTWQKHSVQMTDEQKGEISFYAHAKLDASLSTALFPGLPSSPIGGSVVAGVDLTESEPQPCPGANEDQKTTNSAHVGAASAARRPSTFTGKVQCWD